MLKQGANQTPIPVVINGAAGKMGREVVKAVAQAEDMTLVGAIDRSPRVKTPGTGGFGEPLEVPITDQFGTDAGICRPGKTARSDGGFYPSQYGL